MFNKSPRLKRPSPDSVRKCIAALLVASSLAYLVPAYGQFSVWDAAVSASINPASVAANVGDTVSVSLSGKVVKAPTLIINQDTGSSCEVASGPTWSWQTTSAASSITGSTTSQNTTANVLVNYNEHTSIPVAKVIATWKGSCGTSSTLPYPVSLGVVPPSAPVTPTPITPTTPPTPSGACPPGYHHRSPQVYAGVSSTPLAQSTATEVTPEPVTPEPVTPEPVTPGYCGFCPATVTRKPERVSGK